MAEIGKPDGETIEVPAPWEWPEAMPEPEPERTPAREPVKEPA